MRKVMMVVAVLITSCQVSEKPKIGPETPQPRIRRHASAKVAGRPARCEVRWEKREKRSDMTQCLRAQTPEAGAGSACSVARGAVVVGDEAGRGELAQIREVAPIGAPEVAIAGD